jgi:hypothetical protein
MELQIKSAKNIEDGCEIVAIEGESAKWRNTRKMPALIRFFCSTDPVDEPEARSILDDAKAANIARAVILTSTEFTRAAVDYAASRPLELFAKEKLSGLLKGTNVGRSKARPARHS